MQNRLISKLFQIHETDEKQIGKNLNNRKQDQK